MVVYKPNLEALWRSVILIGKNSASYKFALAKALMRETGSNSELSFEDIAKVYSKELCNHLKLEDKQGTSNSSKFLNICRDFNNGKISYDRLIQTTVQLGFVNVFDAFHNIVNGELDTKFFEKDIKNKKLILTDTFYELITSNDKESLIEEAEARWRLVETAWNLKIPKHHINVKYDDVNNLLFIEENKIRRKNITGIRDALNGYQNGKCFYCGKAIAEHGDYSKVDVDHFFPHRLQRNTDKINLDGAWNLVLSCTTCNRGKNGKSDKIPILDLIGRLEMRNNYLIASNHPLKETLINQIGNTIEKRRQFLKNVNVFALNYISVKWKSSSDFDGRFSLKIE